MVYIQTGSCKNSVLMMVVSKLIIFGCMLVVGCIDVSFKTLSTVYLPYTYSPTALYQLSKNAAEQMSYDPRTKIIYSIGNTNIHVIDINNVTSPQVVFNQSYANVDATDVEVCGEYVFVAFDNLSAREEGFIDVFKVYNKSSGSMDLVKRIIVGDIPDMIHPTKDCRKVIIAIEAEPYINDDTGALVDNPGGVGVITFTQSPAEEHSFKLVDFQNFNLRIADLEGNGVRWIYRENNNLFSNDVEPEYITFNTDETKAYICLQENNAVAVFNMVTEEIEEIYGLGFKQWSTSELDPSDKDGGINMRSWPVYGMYQPDTIKFYKHQGVGYILMANEGDSKDYLPHFSEETRVKDVKLSDIFESNATRRALMQADAQLGRLKITNQNGRNTTTGKFDKLYTFGGRSFSIRRADDMHIVYDSGNDLAHKTALLKPNLFNNNYGEGEMITAGIDTRSDDKGLETESIAIGHLSDDVTLLIIGNERPGTVAVYTIDERLPHLSPKFHTLLTGIPRTNDTWDNLYKTREISMLDPEDLRFVPSGDSPNGKPLLLVSGSTSGTVSIIEVTVSRGPDDKGSDSNDSVALDISKVFLVLCLCLFMLH